MRDRASYPAPQFPLYLPFVLGKSGIEIGGPSSSFAASDVLPIYPQVGTLDNCDFSAKTVWADHAQEFVFSSNRPAGRSYFCEGSQLTPVSDASYDFVLSSHNLEHFANPLKALHEWKRILKPGGALILLLPDYRATFDHRRSPTPLAHMIEDYEQGTAEDDLTHLAEILEKHDLSRDPPAGTFAQFRQRSLDNFHNRCLHHHVFDESNSRALLGAAGFAVLAADRGRPNHICLLAQR
jgi:SAM-dependent methyltransferase